MDIKSLLEKMYKEDASDLILTAAASPQIRIGGFLKPIGSEKLTSQKLKEMVYSILTETQIKKFEEKKELDISYGIKHIARFRVNVYTQRGSIAVAFRLIPYNIPDFEELGLPSILKKFALKQNGLFLVTGPVGSGKSTTLATMIDHINEKCSKHIVSLEDPIEFIHNHKKSIVDQREVGSDTKTFSNALRAVFRQSPDVVMVGEMRDLESIKLVLTLAETGHLILATLHTQDTVHAITRIVDVFPAAQQQQVCLQLSLVLEGVLAQRLLPKKKGHGRVLAYELMNVNHAISNLIRENQPQQIYTMLQTGKKEGMATMNKSLLELYEGDEITAEEAISRSPRPKEMMKILSRAQYKSR